MPRFGFGTDPKRIPSAENLPADQPEKTKSTLFPVTLFIVPIRPDMEQRLPQGTSQSLSLRHDGPSTVESPQSIFAQVQPDRRVLSANLTVMGFREQDRRTRRDGSSGK